jgi:hypothetical protein
MNVLINNTTLDVDTMEIRTDGELVETLPDWIEFKEAIKCLREIAYNSDISLSTDNNDLDDSIMV